MPEPTILLRTSWQTLSVGDISHTPGMVALLERLLPEAKVILWPRDVSHGVREMLAANFPRLEIVEGVLDPWGMPDSMALREAWERADFFLHGSGPGGLFLEEAYRWRMIAEKPFGLFGVTTEWPSEEQADRLDEAAFVLTRETASLAHLRQAGVRKPVVGFCPDAAFACAVRDDRAAEAFLEEAGLEAGGFVCVIPRLRLTPRHKIHGRAPNANDLRRDDFNAEYAETDHEKLRDVIVPVVREMRLKVLLCPEMSYQVDIMDECIVDKLPEDVRAMVRVRRRYWIADEAAAVYARARAVVSLECHSPILALRQGVPIIHLRQPTDTIKGEMYRDLGLGDWIFEIDDVSSAEILDTLRGQLANPQATSRRIAAVLERVDRLHREGVEDIRAALEKAAESGDENPAKGVAQSSELDPASRVRAGR